MSKKTSFPDMVTDFLVNHMPKQRGVSENTISSYSTTFLLLIEYFNQQGIREEDIELEDLIVDTIEAFLLWLETERGCSASTRNQRLSCLRSFARYILHEDVGRYAICAGLLSIPVKKSPEPIIDCICKEDMKLLLAEPDLGTVKGLRDAAMLTLLYDSGCRVTEFRQIKVGDIDFRRGTLKITGKGRKRRTVPINKPTLKIMRKYLDERDAEAKSSDSLLFTNAKGEQLTRQGVSYVVDKYVKACRDKYPEFHSGSITPHTFRHSIATHLLEEGVPLIYIRDFLGHESIKTTERYAKTNPNLMRKAIESHAEKINVEPRTKPVPSKKLSALLKKLQNQ